MTETPRYVMTASRTDRIIAFGHADDLETARAWCEQARDAYLERADQVALAEMHEVHAITGGLVPTMVALEGWRRVGAAWTAIPPSSVYLDFDEMPPGPTSVEELQAMNGARTRRSAPATSTPDAELRRVAGLLVRLSHGVRELAAVARSNTQARKRVLVVDDDKVSRTVLKQALSSHHDVVEADSFASALLELALWDFDAVVTDHDMGALGNGADLLSEVRDRWPHMRRVLCTGVLGNLEQALSQGVAHCLIPKPVDRALVLASVSAD